MLYIGGNGIWCRSPPSEADKALYVVGLYHLPYVLYADGNMICNVDVDVDVDGGSGFCLSGNTARRLISETFLVATPLMLCKHQGERTRGKLDDYKENEENLNFSSLLISLITVRPIFILLILLSFLLLSSFFLRRGQGFLAASRDLVSERRASYGDGKTMVWIVKNNMLKHVYIYRHRFIKNSMVKHMSFNLANALESHTKDKHSAGK
ncbi:hypothetical protein TEA_024553 [Camellia sinensis var. sinensis]|uniref:Uncharacterized protein n=1 Tax=Camellia sinensis var. sinensis TaxID=542762 RepID=A0A4S4EN43_CAMSN|nr:hypothetical protein TEA_024553 [Camellia sinensis var. sinensis]